MKAKSGGGATMNKVTHRPSPKAEPDARTVGLTAVSRIGAHIGNKAMNQPEPVRTPKAPLETGKGYTPPRGPTDNVTAVGVGGGRTVLRSGSQGQHGAVNPGTPQPKSWDPNNYFSPTSAKR